jgi:hypothetical protein
MNTKKKRKKKNSRSPQRRRAKALVRAPKRKRKEKTRPGKRTGRRGKVKKTGKRRVKKVAGKTGKRRAVKKIAVRKSAARRARTQKTKNPRRKRVIRTRKPLRRPIFKSATQKPVYALDTNFEFFYELRDLILKSSPAEKDKMIERLNKVGRVKLAITSGIFINKESLDPLITDLLIVGDDVDRRKLRAFLKATEAEVGKEIKFTVMDKDEFQYRLAMFDRFIRVLLESPHEKLINRLGI